MEALAAVSLAGNILQLLSFAGDAISKSRQIHASVNGALEEHEDLEIVTTNLKDLSVRLQTPAGPVDSVLEQLCIRCREIADELLKALESLCQRQIHTVPEPQKGVEGIMGQRKVESPRGKISYISSRTDFAYYRGAEV